jgi:hypothetical protein
MFLRINKQISGTPFGIPLQRYNNYLEQEKFLLLLVASRPRSKRLIRWNEFYLLLLISRKALKRLFRQNEFYLLYQKYLLRQESDRLEAAVIAGDIGNGCVAGEYKLVNKKRMASQKERGDKGISCVQFGIDGLNHLKPHVAQIAENTAAVG